jgi:predicted RNA-binding Zn ribbon-like protein
LVPPGKDVSLAVTTTSSRNWRAEGWAGEPTGAPRLDGGRLCLDFANTVGGRATDHPSEFLTSYAVLLAWAQFTGAVDDAEAEQLRHAAAQRPNAAAAVHRQAIACRDAIYRIFVAIAREQPPATADLDALTQVYHAALARARLRPHGAAVRWEWSDDAELERPLWQAARSAVAVLTSDDLSRIKVCPGRDGNSCWWVFFDATKNRIRRWCNMAVCGSSAKARRQAAKRRAMRRSRVAPSTAAPQPS